MAGKGLSMVDDSPSAKESSPPVQPPPGDGLRLKRSRSLCRGRGAEPGNVPGAAA